MRRKAGDADGSAGALEIEFEDEDGDGDASPERAVSTADRPRDLRGAALTVLAVVTLGAALSATHHTSSSGVDHTNISAVAVEPDYAAFMVTVSYQGSRVVSLQQRRIEVDLLIKPVPGARVRVLNYYVSENGVDSRAESAPSAGALPASGTDFKLELTVSDCAVAPIGESMGFVNVVAVGPVGTTDRFTILGASYSADLARMLRTVCPARDTAGGTA